MREIKFRRAFPPETLKDESGKLNKWTVKVIEGDFARNYPVIMLNNDFHMQFTGLKDKNGKEIYEGDILKRDEYDVREVKAPEWFENDAFDCYGYEVVSGYFIRDYPGKDFTTKNEIIGNIYENPELLTKTV